jgi:hypothetical protein
LGWTEYLAVRRSMLVVLRKAARPERQMNAPSEDLGEFNQT